MGGLASEEALINALDNDALAPQAASALSSKSSLDINTFRTLATLAKAGNGHATQVQRDRINLYRTEHLQKGDLRHRHIHAASAKAGNEHAARVQRHRLNLYGSQHLQYAFLSGYASSSYSCRVR